MRARRHGTRAAAPRGLPEPLRSFGFTALFAAGMVVLGIVAGHDPELASFHGASGSQATLDGVDVGARASLYLRGLAGFALTGLAVLLSAGPVARLLGRRDAALLDAVSVAGVALVAAKLFGASTRAPLLVVVALQAGIVAVALVDRLHGVRGPHEDRAAYLAWLAAAAFGLVSLGTGALPVAAPDALRSAPAGIAAFVLCGVALHFAVSVAAGSGRGDRWLYALAPLALAPLVAPLALELALQLDGARLAKIEPAGAGLVLAALLAAWCAWRLVRAERELAVRWGTSGGRLALEELVARRVLPWALFAAVVFTWYLTVIPVSKDLAEPGNAGLSIQQLLEFGRLPFLETFDGHGLTGSGFGFPYAALTGMRDETWQFFDFMEPALAALIAYQVVRRLAGSPYAAAAVVLLLPARDALFPEYCVFALTAVFVLRAVLARDTVLGWAMLALYAFAAVVWRIDIGFASGVATLCVLAALPWSADGWWPAWGRAVRGALAAGAGLAALYLGLALARGLDPVAIVRRLLHVVSSNQAWGYSKVAPELDAVARAWLFLAPVLVLGVLAAWLALTRGALPRPRGAPGESATGVARGSGLHAWIAVVFGAAYFFANYPRGIVRHSFMEHENVYVASFAPLVLCSIAFWGGTSRSRFAAFALGATLLAALVPPGQPDRGRTASSRVVASLFERLAEYPTFPAGPRPVDRSPTGERAGLRHAAELVEFMDRNLTPEQTWLDLSFSPMLYVLGHRRSPGYLNHLILAHDEYLQRDAIADLARADAPLALVGQESVAERRADVPRWNAIDGVSMSVRQPLLFEHARSAFRPLAAVGRWYVWARDGFGLSAAPSARASRGLARWSADEEAWPGRLAVEVPAAEGAPGRRAATARVARVCARDDMTARPTGSIRLGFAFEGGARDERTLDLEPGCERWLPVPEPALDAPLAAVLLDDGDAALLAELEVLHLDEPAWRPIEHVAREPVHDELGDLPRVVAELGMPELGDASPLATLYEASAAADVELALRPLEAGPWRNGVHTKRAGVALVAPEPGLGPGDVLAFAAAGERRVEGVDGPRVWLAGEPLDPERDGAPATATWTGRRLQRLPVSPEEPAAFALPPLAGPRHPVFLWLALRETGSAWNDVLVRVLRGERVLGTYVFRVRLDERVRHYAVRLSTQYNWLVGAPDRIEIAPREGPLELESARLVRAEEERP